MSSQNSICMAWHGTSMAKYLKKTTDLTIGINALISGSHTKKLLESSIGARLAVSDVQGLLLS